MIMRKEFTVAVALCALSIFSFQFCSVQEKREYIRPEFLKPGDSIGIMTVSSAVEESIEEGKWVQAKDIKDISGFTHGIGWCAPQQGACKLTLNVKEGIIEEALVEVLGCSGMTHSAAMASEILIGKTLLEALNTDLVCDAINTAMRELFLQIVYGRTQSAFSENGLAVGSSLEDLGKGLRSQVGTMFGTKDKGPRYLEMAEGYCTRMALNANNEVIGYEFVNLGKMMDFIKKGIDANEALEKAKGHYGQWDAAVKYIDPRQE